MCTLQCIRIVCVLYVHCMCMHECLHICVNEFVHPCVRASMYHPCVCAPHTCSCIHILLHVYVHAYKHVCVHPYTGMYACWNRIPRRRLRLEDAAKKEAYKFASMCMLCVVTISAQFPVHARIHVSMQAGFLVFFSLLAIAAFLAFLGAFCINA